MRAIRDAGPALLNQILVQIFAPEQLEVVKELGYPHVLFTLITTRSSIGASRP